jgi:hypothetical protein
MTITTNDKRVVGVFVHFITPLQTGILSEEIMVTILIFQWFTNSISTICQC